jgi:hypothetical protein
MMRGLVHDWWPRPSRLRRLSPTRTSTPTQRADLISELARRWVRNDPDATIAWANNLAAPEDFRAAIPLLVSQLDNDG